MVLDKHPHWLSHFVLDTQSHALNHLGQLIEYVDYIFAHENYVFVLLLVVFKPAEQLTTHSSYTFTESLEQLISVNSELFNLLQPLDILSQLLPQDRVESHALLN